MRRQKHTLIVTSAVACMALCSCGKSKVQNLSNGKVLLQVSLDEKKRLFTNLGITNVLTHGPVERDSRGTKIFIRVEIGTSYGAVQESRTQQLVVVTSQGAQMKPWHFPANERVTDDEEVAIWQHPAPDYTWQVRNGELLDKGCSLADVSGNWIAAYAHGRAPWIARLDTPNVAAAELPDSPGLVAIFADADIVHVFARRGWRNDEGQMKYYVFDFSRRDAKPIKEMTFPWARISLDMDPKSACAVLNDNNRFWGRSWLLDLKTGKRKSVSISDWAVIVNKDVAEKWIELTKT